MSNITNSLDKYTRAVDAVRAHEESNRAIFDAHKKLVMTVIDAENELRDDAAGMIDGLTKNVPHVVAEDGLFRVIITPQTLTVYDEEKIRAAGAGSAITEQQRPPRITISPQRTPKS